MVALEPELKQKSLDTEKLMERLQVDQEEADKVSVVIFIAFIREILILLSYERLEMTSHFEKMSSTLPFKDLKV